MGYEGNREFFRDYFASSMIAHAQHFLLYGPPSIIGGFHFGPVYYYILAISQFVFRFYPWSLPFASVVISTLSVFVLYHLLLLWFGEKLVARIGSILCALSMFSIFLGEYVSNPNFLPLFLLWFFYVFTKILRGDKNKWNYFWAGVSFSISSQLHVTAMVLLICMILTGIIWRKNIASDIKNSCIFICGMLLIYSTYIYYQITTHFSEFGHLVLFSTKKVGFEVGGNALLPILRFIEASFLPIPNIGYAFTNLLPNYLYLIVMFIICVFIFIFAKQVIRIINARDQLVFKRAGLTITKEGKFVFTCWIFFSVFMLFAYHNTIRYYYLIMLWPVPIIILLYVAYWLKNKYKVFYSFLAIFLVIFVLEIFSFYYSEPRIPWSIFNTDYQIALKTNLNILEVGAPSDVLRVKK